MRTAKGQHWSEVESASYEDESGLQALLSKSPGLVPVDEIGEAMSPFVFAVREYGLPGSGSTDLLLFNAEGQIGIVECKLRANAQIKREVVGQIMEYAAHLWNSTYDEVDTRSAGGGNKSLAEQVGALVDDPDWSPETFREGVSVALQTGAFHLIVAVDEVNPELKRTVDYLNEAGSTSFTFHALELQKYRKGETEMLVPHLYGKVPQRPSKPRRRTWSSDSYMQQASAKLPENQLALVKELHEWARNEADEVSFGTGSETASFTFRFHEQGSRVSVFTLYADGRLDISYDYIAKHVDAERIRLFDAELRRKPPFDSLPKKTTGFLSITLKQSVAGGAPALEHLKHTVGTLRTKTE